MTITQKRSISKMILACIAISFAFISSVAFAEATGTWTNKYQEIDGKWKIIKDADGAKLVLGKDFGTTGAPDLKFILSNKTVEEMDGDNAIDGAVIISKLKSSSGAQEYKLPNNFSDFKTLALLCEKYSKLWGATDISNAK